VPHLPARSSLYRRIVRAVSAFWPPRQPISLREKCRASAGATLTTRVDLTLAEAWAVVRKHRIKALPVVDSRQHVLGIVTVADFMGQIDLDVHEGLGQRLRALVRPQLVQARRVGQIMTRTVRVASYDRLLIDLVPVFSENGHRHTPIIDESQRLVGIITQSDLVCALYTAVRA